jgi:Flp pilus assembly pilin Flp
MSLTTPNIGKPRSDTGQTTAEYGLVILAAGTLALAVILWARSSGSITGLFESVVEQLTGNVG